MTKSKPSLKSNDLDGFLRAFTDEWQDLKVTYQVNIDLIVEPSPRRGVLRLSLVAYPREEGRTGVARGYYQCEYPSSRVESLECCLFRCGVQLERILRDRAIFPAGKG